MRVLTLSLLMLIVAFWQPTGAKEISLSFDDTPMPTTSHFESFERTHVLLAKLEKLGVPSTIFFVNPCKFKDEKSSKKLLTKIKNAGHLIGNHTCTHPRFDDISFDTFKNDFLKTDIALAPFLGELKLFRFPYLNEGRNLEHRDAARRWLQQQGYRNGFVSVDNDDYLFSFKINQARDRGRTVNYGAVKALFINHVIGGLDFYHTLSLKTLGYSPKHTLLLHDMDATVLFIEDLVHEIRSRGWKIVSAQEAYTDPLYSQSPPKSRYSGNGIISQHWHDKSGQIDGYFDFDRIKNELNKLLGL